MHTKVARVTPDNFDIKIIKEAAAILKKGGIVAFPTETVYGLAADYNNPVAIDRLYEIKKRPKDKPFTILIARKEKILEFVNGLDGLSKRLIDKFWPGPLTIIVNSKDGKSLGFRMPSNRIALELVEASNLTIVAPSANISGAPDPLEPFSVVQAFDGQIEMVIDAGPTQIGVSSTVVDATSLRPKILREGSNTAQVKAVILEEKKITNMLIVCTGNSCRSPMAEALLKRELEKDGFNVKSAGIIAVDGMSASRETIEVVKQRAGISLSGFKSQRLTEELAVWADIIIVMDKTQESFIKDMFPFSVTKQKVVLFKDFADVKDGNPNVTDPMGRAVAVYEETYRQIQQGISIIAKKIRQG